jgi:hypothetical protein
MNIPLRLLGVVSFVSALGGMACASSADSSSTGDEQAATAAHSTFQCTVDPSQDQGALDSFKLTLADGSAKVEASDIGTVSGKLDPKYAPKTSADYVRYLVNGLYDEGASDLLVEKTLPTSAKGTVKVESKGEGFFSVPYSCKAIDSDHPAPSSGKGGASTSPVNGTLNLNCSLVPNQGAGFSDPIKVTVDATKMSVDSSDMIGEGPFDSTYRPRANTGYVRYNVSDLIDDYGSDVLIEKTVLAGNQGHLKIEGAGETFVTATYNCQATSH